MDGVLTLELIHVSHKKRCSIPAGPKELTMQIKEWNALFYRSPFLDPQHVELSEVTMPIGSTHLDLRIQIRPVI